MLQKKVREENIHVHIWSDMNSPYLSPEIMAKGKELFDQAEKLADNPDVLDRMKHTRLSLEYVKIIRELDSVGASGTSEQKAAALKKLESFIKECEADGIKELNEGCPIRARFDQLAVLLSK